ncbi:MAG: sortase [Chloroflexi bacterium]|nr:sortase [Chloroflexota bacterium]
MRRDKRSVDELSIEELERILVIRKRELRQERLRRMDAQGRRLSAPLPVEDLPPELPPQQHESAEDVPPPEPPSSYDITGDVPRFEDDLEFEDRRKKQETKRAPVVPVSRDARGRVSRPRAAWDKILLAVEVVGVIGIIAVLVGGGYLLIIENDRIDALAEKSAGVQREAEAMRITPTPAPELRVQLSDYVLPGGHYSPDIAGEAFNPDELPASIRPAAIAQLTAPQAARATPQSSSPVHIEITTPRVKVNASIYGGDDWFTLQRGVGHYLGSASPGENANMVLSAHNDIYGEIFRDIQYLEPGDEVRIQANNNRWYTYVVFEKRVVAHTEVSVMAPGNQPIVTLITCHPYRVDDKRMVVHARLKQDQS